MLPDLTGTFLAPMAAALVGGIYGLFLMQSSKDADGRLVLAGVRPFEVILARLGLLVSTCLVVTAAASSILLVQFDPASPAPLVAAVFLAAVTYGMVGVLVGLVLDSLPGVYVMLFAPTIDIMLFQNPVAESSVAWSWVLPGHYVTAAAVDAGFGSGFSTRLLVLASAYVGVLTVLASVAFRLRLRK